MMITSPSPVMFCYFHTTWKVNEHQQTCTTLNPSMIDVFEFREKLTFKEKKAKICNNKKAKYLAPTKHSRILLHSKNGIWKTVTHCYKGKK